MAIPGGASKPPAYAGPHDKKAHDEWLFRGGRFEASAKATLVLVTAGAIWLLGAWAFQSSFWYLGIILWVAAGAVFVLWR